MDITKTALVLIDFQKESNFDIHGLEGIIKNSKKLIDVARSKGIPIIYTRQINQENLTGLSNNEPLDDENKPVYYASNTKSIEIFDEIKPTDKDIIIDKYRWSGFYQTSLDLMLRSLNIKHIIIGGLVTDGCLMTTVFDGYFRNYQMNLVKDISGATSSGAHMSSILIMANWVYDLKIYDTEELIKKLDGKEHKVWKTTKPDELQFTPDNLQEVFNKLNKIN